MKKLILIIIIFAIFASSAVYAAMSFDCLDGETCHALMYADSGMYILCANGGFNLEQNGPDSWYVTCGGGHKAMMPITYNGGTQ